MHRRLLAAMATAVLALTAIGGDAAQRAEREVIGLYVGIGAYEDPSVWSFSLHETNRDVLLPLLAERFGVRWLPAVMDAAATRDGVRAGMMGLLNEARTARARGADVTVVFLYTGHGSQLRDQDGDEPDGKDESLVTHRSSIEEGAYDIRDDDIAAFRRAVTGAGAELVLIMEACHSESTFRGPPPLALRRPRRPPGPKEPLFDELSAFYAAPPNHKGGSSFLDGSPAERFVCLAAAQDERPASTTYVGDRQWGCFSLALVTALETLPAGATYRDLHRSVVRDFDVRFPSERQRPTLHPRDGCDLADQPVFGGDFRSPHARVTFDAASARATLDAGAARGYGVDTRVAFFATIDDLEAWERDEDGAAPIAEGRIAAASFETAFVDEVDALPETAVAHVTVPALPPAGVWLGAGIDPELAAAVRGAADPTVVRFTDDVARASFTLEARDASSLAVLPVGDAAHPGAPSEANDGTALRTIRRRPDATGTARAAAADLEFVVRTQRFWGLLGDGHDVEVRLRLAAPDGGELPRSGDGTLVCTNGTRVTITMTNRAAEPRRIGLFQSEAPDGVLGAFALVYQSPTRIEPGASITLTGPMALSDDRRAREVLRLKVVSATVDRIELPRALIDPADTERLRSGGTDADPFAAMFGNAQSGTRAATEALGWASQNLTVEIRPAHDD